MKGNRKVEDSSVTVREYARDRGKNERASSSYFYATEDAKLYDCTIRYLAPMYDLLHGVIARVVRATVEAGGERIINVLDIGCGTGEEALRIAEQLPTARVVALDISREMLSVFERKLQSHERCSLAPRIRLVQADITSEEWSADKLCSLAPPGTGGERYDAIVSAFVLHHFTADVLARLYHQFYNSLRPGGVFVNGDISDFWPEELSSMAFEFGINYIKEQLASVEARDAVEKLGGNVNELRDKWITHMYKDNMPLPIEDSCKEAGFASRKGSSALLRESGFAEIACPFRHWQDSVLWARR